MNKNSIIKVVNYLKKNKNTNVVNCYTEIKNDKEFKDISIIKVVFNSFKNKQLYLVKKNYLQKVTNKSVFMDLVNMH